jgi:hypothetical protein
MPNLTSVSSWASSFCNYPVQKLSLTILEGTGCGVSKIMNGMRKGVFIFVPRTNTTYFPPVFLILEDLIKAIESGSTKQVGC